MDRGLASAQAELLPEYLAAIAGETTLCGQIGALLRASASIHRRRPAITPFLASMSLELRRHPDLLAVLEDVGTPLVITLHEMFDAARRSGEIPSDAEDLDLMIAFSGAAMGIGLLSFGLGHASMDSAVGTLERTMTGTFFGPGTE
ncbi:hypothetical protein A5777_05225 [Gordonia sp. 852002-10350_SCH5691597]|nr:hypothetical protein A5777_05225 [Gordonia sp. 852002-10350_SCH5691597]